MRPLPRFTARKDVIICAMAYPTGKDRLRDSVWRRLIDEGVTHCDAYGSIPPFAGAAAAAARLAELDFWKQARVIKANPDVAQLAVRQRALLDGKLLYMAVPRLATPRPFFRLDPAVLPHPVEDAAAKEVAAVVAPTVGVDEMRPIDVVICGSVAVNRTGSRLGKGAGYSDLEIALLVQAGLVTDRTVIVAPVHEVQLTEEAIPVTEHDVGLDVIVTPERVLHCTRQRRPPGILWDHLSPEKVAAIPVLAAAAGKQGAD